jgi:outer membrane lipoprotein-sorting protein
LRRINLIETRKLVLVLAAVAALASPACLLRRETHIQPSQLPAPAREASLNELVTKLNAISQSVHSLTVTVDLEPTTGSIYSGVIKEYHDVRGFILAETPAMIRILGQAPLVRTDVFDMVSNGEEFRLYIPPLQKFIVGKTAFRRPTKNSLENLRPQHILEALLVPALDPSREKWLLEEAQEAGHRFYVVVIVEGTDGELQLKRKAWFDRADLQLARMQFYESDGLYVEDVRYSAYQDFQGVSYPSHIEVVRPIEDYRLAITILKATFNQPIDADKFVLTQPPGTQLVDLNAKAQQENPSGQ